MTQSLAIVIVFVCMLALPGVSMSQPATAPSAFGDLDWPPITRTSKPWARWWWPGSAVDQANLRQNLEQLASHGFGGVEITPIYEVTGAEDRSIKFLSPQWMQMLQFVGTEGERL